jgi:hypothetical protein
MSLVNHPFVCDGPGCGKRRENDTNHWFLLWEFMFGADNLTGFACLPWNVEEALKPGRVHACGVNCALKLTERALTIGTLDFAAALEKVSKEVKH